MIKAKTQPIEAYTLAFILPGLPKILSNGSHGHWRAAHEEKKKWRIKAANMAIICGLPSLPLLKARLTLTRFSSVEPDFDGLVSSFKPIIDGLTNAGVIKDDKMSVIGRPDYLWEKVSPKQGKIRICVEAV